MTQTELVRTYLKFLGVEWEEGYGFTPMSTIIKTREGNTIEIEEHMSGNFSIHDLTHEQAARIAAILA